LSWLPPFEESSIKYGKAATALKNKKRFLYVYPTAADVILDANGDPTTMLVYEHQGDALAITRAGKTQLAADIREYHARLEKFEVISSGLLSHLYACMSPASKTLLKTHPSFQEASATNDVYAIFEQVQATHVTVNARNTFRHLADFLSLQQDACPNSFESLVEKLRLGEAHLTREFGDAEHASEETSASLLI
jgi:hypothetical protein